MIGRNLGCEAMAQDNGRDATLLPVCMGGTAVSGAYVTIVGCNKAAECTPMLPCPAGYVNHVVTKKGRVVGVYEIKRDVPEAAPVAPPVRTNELTSNLPQPVTLGSIEPLASPGYSHDKNADIGQPQSSNLDNNAPERLSFSSFSLVSGI